MSVRQLMTVAFRIEFDWLAELHCNARGCHFAVRRLGLCFPPPPVPLRAFPSTMADLPRLGVETRSMARKRKVLNVQVHHAVRCACLCVQRRLTPPLPPPPQQANVTEHAVLVSEDLPKKPRVVEGEGSTEGAEATAAGAADENGLVEVVVLASAELEPVSAEKAALRRVRSEIESEVWHVQFYAIEQLRRLVVHHPKLVARSM